MSDAIQPFHLAVPQAELDDLRERLSRARWPDRETVDDTSQGPLLAKVRALCDRWRDHYDWRRCEALLNGFGRFRTEIDGLGGCFLHVRSPEPDALPLVITHGWPSSVLEFRHVVGLVTDPAAHGGDPRDALDLVADQRAHGGATSNEGLGDPGAEAAGGACEHDGGLGHA